MSGFSPRVKAVLGPTNTGKTHLAIERLLAHSSGIIGFPLRLLARENYDRMVARKGIRNVALITGEEKIVPPDARYFSCTVEAMPLDRRVEFLAVDEIQLCADPDRGHIFTDRLLHARGMVETMFLGAETIRWLLKRLVPEAEIETRPRLSELSYAGPAKLSKLPPRSAIVAFSGAEVYAIAEAVRRKRGGCAVVMGRLSPRTRNAQVALYQEKEVDFLVATDAIGMGLNMDVDHVAFAGLSKFDGHRPRPLMAPEVAQIAGRAGRGMRDGTFGVTANCPPLAEELVKAVEAHAFEPLGQLFWRNSDLDFFGIDALLQSLTAPPPAPGLIRGNEATDVLTLNALGMDAEIRSLAQGKAATRLLWEACQIPDFRKLATDQHAKLCAKVYIHLRRENVLPVAWIGAEFANLDKTEGDIDTLMQRLADVRVWAYITARADWMRDAAPWASRAREIEDKISDTLHEKLMARFVDRRAAHLTRRLEALEQSGAEELLSAVSARGGAGGGPRGRSYRRLCLSPGSRQPGGREEIPATRGPPGAGGGDAAADFASGVGSGFGVQPEPPPADYVGRGGDRPAAQGCRHAAAGRGNFAERISGWRRQGAPAGPARRLSCHRNRHAACAVVTRHRRAPCSSARADASFERGGRHFAK
jgi:ATP-dependent RNA helicase SUPV3L1/SUV3